MQVHDDEERRCTGRMQVANEPTVVDLPHDVFDGVERGQLARLVEHGEENARGELQHEHEQCQRAEEVPDIEILRGVVAGELAGNELIHRHPLVEPAQEPLPLGLGALHCSHYAAPLWVSSTPTTSLSGDGNE